MESGVSVEPPAPPVSCVLRGPLDRAAGAFPLPLQPVRREGPACIGQPCPQEASPGADGPLGVARQASAPSQTLARISALLAARQGALALSTRSAFSPARQRPLQAVAASPEQRTSSPLRVPAREHSITNSSIAVVCSGQAHPSSALPVLWAPQAATAARAASPLAARGASPLRLVKTSPRASLQGQGDQIRVVASPYQSPRASLRAVSPVLSARASLQGRRGDQICVVAPVRTPRMSLQGRATRPDR